MYREGRRWGGGIPPWSAPASRLPALATLMHPLASLMISNPNAQHHKNLFSPVRARTRAPLSYRGITLQAHTRQSRGRNRQGRRIAYGKSLLAARVKTADEGKGCLTAHPRARIAISRTPPDPTNTGQTLATSPRANDTVCPATRQPQRPTPTVAG